MLWTPTHLSDREGVCGRQSLEVALVPSGCQAVRTVARHRHSIWDANWSVNYFLKGCVVLSWERVCTPSPSPSLSLSLGHWSRQARNHFLVKSVSEIKPGEIVSECNTLELCLHKEPVLAPWDPVRHRPWTPFSSEVMKSCSTSGPGDTQLSSLLSSFCRLNTNPSEQLDFPTQPKSKHPNLLSYEENSMFPK